MPFTFLAHQGPFLPLVRRWSRHLDPVTFLVGTTAPDLAYVAGDSSLRVWAHAMPWLVTFNVPATLLVSWLLVRVVAPVLPAHLPEAGGFRLRDYRVVARHRFHVLRSPLGALAGAVSHVVLDGFTHRWGWVADGWRWYRTPLVDERWLGKDWAPFEVMQYVGHVAGSAVFVWLVWRYGRERLLAAAAAEVPLAPVTRASRALLAGFVTVGAAGAAAVVLAAPSSEADDIIRIATGTFVGLLLGCVAARWAGGEAARRDTAGTVGSR